MKILITGSSGHLGEALVRVLSGTDHDLISVDIIPSDFTSVVGSLVDRALVKKCMKDVDVVLHTATLHKPHVVTHSHQDFIDTNITATLNLLEEAKSVGVKAFIFTSTTSTFGDAMKAPTNGPAVWVNEDLVPIPKNIYGVTKIAAENLCQLFHRNHQLPILILKTARFFLEKDDNKDIRDHYQDANIKANEYLYRRVDIEDVVNAHLLAIDKAASIGFGRYIISATTAFSQEDLVALHQDATAVVQTKYPAFNRIYDQYGWKMFPTIERVYFSKKAQIALNWQPKYDFQFVLDCLEKGIDFRSPLSLDVGIKGYHTQVFEGDIYPV